MNKFKTALAVLLTATLSTFACWWTDLNYNYNYIYAVNNVQIHYSESGSFYSAQYLNGMNVALPLTVYVKIGSGTEGGATSSITEAKLQYRVKRNGSWITNWVTVRTVTSSQFPLSVNNPVSLFGNGTIDPRNMQTGDQIYIRYYITNGIIESGDLSDNLNDLECSSIETSSTSYSGGWSPPFIFKVIYNGERRIGW